MRNKKGLSIGTVFIFMIAAITFGVIMIFGYKAISDFLEKGEKVEFYQFKTDLERSVKGIYTEYGSVRVQTFYLPSRYERICFVDLDTEPNLILEQDNPIAYDVWDTAFNEASMGTSVYDKADQNVFLEPLPPIDSPTIKVYKIEPFEIKDGEEINSGYLCFDIVRGKFKLRMEGMGDRTKISEVKE
jgi:hypothetical protein